VGYEAARLLQRMLDGKSVLNRPIRVSPMGVITRESSDIIAVEDPILAAALRYIQENLSEGVNVKQLVHHMSVSRRKLELEFRRRLGRTIHDEITLAKVHRASQLLVDGQTSLQQITKACGMRHPSRLNNLLKKCTGMTPMQYRWNRLVSDFSRTSMVPSRKNIIQKAIGSKAWITISEMAARVGLSRDRFYDLIHAGTFPSPVYGIRNRRPFYSPELQTICLAIRERSIGFDGIAVVFNKARTERVDINAASPT
jgi:excisionase family DNA binding protein